MNNELLNIANQNWEAFVESLSDDEKNGLVGYSEAIERNRVFYFASIKDAKRFDQAINTLSNNFLYDVELIPTVYKYYIERELHGVAFDYIQKAKEHLNQSKISISSDIQKIIEKSITVEVLNSIQKSLVIIKSVRAKDIPHITPIDINDKRSLNEFVLQEIVQASKVLIDKIQSVKQITNENRFNDLFLLALRLRFQIWNWSITDQPRKGNSSTKKDSGELDIVIEKGNTTFALLEALNLTGRDKTKTEEHILKSFDYAKNLERYYMIVYFRGDPSALNTTWDSYKEDVANCSYKPNFVFDTVKSFEDLSNKFDDINHLKIAKSTHGRNVEMFHIMIDLSEDNNSKKGENRKKRDQKNEPPKQNSTTHNRT